MSKRPASLILCSRNRASQLERALAALPEKEFVADDVELVLVDSASTDDTHTVMEEFAETVPFDVHVVRAPRPGLGLARNYGIEAASGRLLFFTDDDCYLTPGYFRKALQVFEQRPELGYLGGRLVLHDPKDARVALNEQSTPEELPPFTPVPSGKISGANMAFRAEILRRIGGFRDYLGAGTPFRCEDVEAIARASMSGVSGAFVPELVVRHHHGRSRLDAVKLDLANAVANGAYYTHMLLDGHWAYALFWLRRALRPRVTTPVRVALELYGAKRFVLSGVHDAASRR